MPNSPDSPDALADPDPGWLWGAVANAHAAQPAAHPPSGDADRGAFAHLHPANGYANAHIHADAPSQPDGDPISHAGAVPHPTPAHANTYPHRPHRPIAGANG